ncbi:sodium/potassium-transporting ATPase subunit beta-1 [Drosophila santomea]|uniref:sodium/potassium-transporting ATPase subunit beta-1 n=1 Tax=Drosophila santomea TaxID=129105 RepID=UPI00195316D1|nr:sodium/potassium-transporting ATPase subunit beta-1 [Drosophila santomea]
MPEDVMVPAGDYKLVKQIRRTQEKRRKKDLPWTKRVFDIDDQKLFGRTAFAWLRITLYYLFLYFLIFIIVAFWVTILLLAIIDPKKPRWLKGHPGLSMVPNQNRSVLEYFTHLVNEVNPIADRIDDFLNKLNDNANDFFSDFNQDTSWGYATQKPTVFIKLNKVFGYQPETYDTPDDLPKEAPSSLQGTVGKLGNTPKIWLTCEVTEGPKPDMVFYPGPYFEASEEMTGVTRVVAIQMNKMPKNSKIFFHCKVWARNIPIEDYQGTGHLKFALNMRYDKDSNQASTYKSTTPQKAAVPPAVDPANPNKERPEDQLGGLEMPPSPENEKDALDKMGNNPQKEDMTEPPS